MAGEALAVTADDPAPADATASSPVDRRLAERRRRIRRRLVPAASGLVIFVGVLILLAVKLAASDPTIAPEQVPATTNAVGSDLQRPDAQSGLGGFDADTGQTGAEEAAVVKDASADGTGESESSSGAGQASGSSRAEVVTTGPQGKMQVALTFDNNYQSASSLQIVQTLKNSGVPATVFLIGDLVASTPQLTAAIADAGLEVGDATFSYTDCNAVSPEWQRQEIGEGSRAYENSTGKKAAALFRPPYGTYNDTTLLTAAEKGLSHVVLWDVDSQDTASISSSEIVANVLDNAHDGAIVLLHLDGANTAQALPEIISGLEDKGFTLVTVSKLLASS